MHGSGPQSSIAVVLGHGRSLETVDRQETMQLLKTRGVVLFRGFAASSDAFVTFTDRFCHRFLRHSEPALRPTRLADGTLVGVLTGNGSVSLHAEMNYRPIRPDVLWFHCTQPASGGGQTIVADSRRVLATLAAETRRRFENQRVRYRYVLEPASWQRVVPVKRRRAAIAILNLRPNLTARAAGGDNIELEFVADAIRPTGANGALGFLNSVENGLEYQLDVAFADGQPIDAATLQEIGRAGQLCAEPIEWERQDIAMINNSLIMHGRRSFEGDQQRLIDVRFGMLRPDAGYAKWLVRGRELLASIRGRALGAQARAS